MALCSAVAWGTADFIGGMAAKRTAMPIVLLGTSLGGTLFAALLVGVSGQSVPPAGDLLLGAAAGLAGLAALSAFYTALAIGKMSIVAPISASGTAIPVAVGIADGDPVGLLTVTGFVLTVGGVMLASREQQEATQEEPAPALEDGGRSGHQRSIPLAFAAAAGFGLVFVLIARASEHSELWPALSLKGTSLAVMAVVVAAIALVGRKKQGDDELSTSPLLSPLRVWSPLLFVGTLDVTANATYAYATTHGVLSVTAVLAAMFPVVTVLLAHKFLGERLITAQKAGVLLALVGVALLASA